MKSGIHVSVIIATRNRPKETKRAIESIAKHHLQSWEIVVVNDASDDSTKDVILELAKKHNNIVDIHFEKKQERVSAYNTGLRYARGEWLYMLDSDDEVMSHFIKVIEQQIEDHPEANFINWGSVIHHHSSGLYSHSTIDPVLDAWNWDKKFKEMSGRYMFNRKMFNEVGFLPDCHNAYTFAERVRKWYPEINKLVDPNQANLGLPWGQDWLWFLLAHKEEMPMQLNQLLHISHKNHDKL